MNRKSNFHRRRPFGLPFFSTITSGMVLLFHWACDRDEHILPLGEVSFITQMSAPAPTSGEVYQALLSFSDVSGTVTRQLLRARLHYREGAYTTNGIRLPVGDYSLTEFFVTDANDHILYVAPLKDSKMAKFVTKPLAFSFSARKNDSTLVTLETIEIVDTSSPQDFGFTEFKLPIAQVFNTWMTLINNDKEVAGDVRVEGKNAAGNVLWSSVSEVGEIATALKIKSRYAYYTFTMDAGGITKQISITEANLRENPYLKVGLAEADYYKYTTSDGNVTVLFPKDPTNPYCEMKVADKSKISYGYVSRSFWLNGQPVHNELYRSLESAVDNVTFKPFAMFNGEYGKTWDVSYGSVVYLSTSDVFDEIHHTWD